LLLPGGKAVSSKDDEHLSLNCFHQPFETALGIFTLIVLSRDSVKQLFEANKSSTAPPGNVADR
jgi:hypothetical protein